MSKLLRYYSEGQVYFITSVTYQRKSILLDHPEIWLRAIRETKDDETFDLIAWVLMPDYFHIIIQPRECNPDKILKHIKLIYSHNYRKANGLYKYKIWQARFWDHPGGPPFRRVSKFPNLSYIHIFPTNSMLI